MTRPPYNRILGPRNSDGMNDRQSPYSPRNSRSRADYPGRTRSGPPSPPGGSGGIRMNTGTIAVLAGVLVVGVGIGSAITSITQGGQGNIASQQQLDMAVPDPEFCRQWGASAFVIDVEMYTTLNPSTSFVTQPALQPGCRAGWVTKLVDGLSVVYISTSITNALAPHCLQNSGSGTAMSSCC